MELKTIIIILELLLLFGVGFLMVGVSIGLMLRIAEKVYDWRQ